VIIMRLSVTSGKIWPPTLNGLPKDTPREGIVFPLIGPLFGQTFLLEKLNDIKGR
jgi:hypothetical protein